MKVVIRSENHVRLVTVSFGARASQDSRETPGDSFSFEFYMLPDEAIDFAESLEMIARQADNEVGQRLELEIT